MPKKNPFQTVHKKSFNFHTYIPFYLFLHKNLVSKRKQHHYIFLFVYSTVHSQGLFHSHCPWKHPIITLLFLNFRACITLWCYKVNVLLLISSYHNNQPVWKLNVYVCVCLFATFVCVHSNECRCFCSTECVVLAMFVLMRAGKFHMCVRMSHINYYFIMK